LVEKKVRTGINNAEPQQLLSEKEGDFIKSNFLHQRKKRNSQGPNPEFQMQVKKGEKNLIPRGDLKRGLRVLSDKSENLY